MAVVMCTYLGMYLFDYTTDMSSLELQVKARLLRVENMDLST